MYYACQAAHTHVPCSLPFFTPSYIHAMHFRTGGGQQTRQATLCKCLCFLYVSTATASPIVKILVVGDECGLAHNISIRTHVILHQATQKYKMFPMLMVKCSKSSLFMQTLHCMASKSMCDFLLWTRSKSPDYNHLFVTSAILILWTYNT